MSDKCFRKCVTSPSTSLDNREQVGRSALVTGLISLSLCFQKCVGNCMDRYMETWNIVSRAYTDKLRKDSGQH